MNNKYFSLWYLILTLRSFSIAVEPRVVPVFLSDHKKVLSVNIEANPFKKMLATDFSTNILKEVKEKGDIVLIFVEPTLCMEDVSLKDDSGTPYFYLSQGIKDENVKFFPSVMSPYKTLMDIFPLNSDNTFYLSGLSISNSIKQKMYNSKLKHFYIWFQYEKENKPNILRNHDRIMQEIYLTMGNINPGSVISVYTGKTNPTDLHLLNVPKIRSDQELILQSYGAMFRLSGLYTSVGTAKRRFLYGQVPLISDEVRKSNGLSTRIAYLDYEIEFNFNLGNDNWVFDNVTLKNLGEDVGLKKVGSVVPWNSSYACAHPLEIVHVKNGTAIIISRYQIQPFHDQSPAEKRRSLMRNKKFGPPVSCTPYFSAPILAGLLVTSLCAAMLLIAVMFLYNCHANDRYDDPHGKSLLEKNN